MKARPHAALLAGLLMAGAAHADQAAGVHASNAWIRVMPAGLPAGGYAVLHNDGDAPATLTGASSTAYAGVMLHQSSTEGGMGRMKMIDRLEIPAHGEVALAPGGYHLMLMHGSDTVRVGGQVPVTLQFADGSHATVSFLARPANAIGAGPGSDATPAHDHGG
ncbi:MAG TPA: copper chaperone PCu(A)C [Dyella sp.]|nr:copper chaperone PCu(A)C [Dyella sp.]